MLVLYFAIGALVLAGRYWILPDIDRYRPAMEQSLSKAIGLPVKIAAISADWPGLHPSLSIEGLQLLDRTGRPALSFDRVEAEVGWSSLWHLGMRLHRLQIVAPVLDVRRDRSGIFHVAGLPMQGEGDSGFAEWLLTQGRIVISEATIQWHDELRNAPPLELHKLHFELRNAGRRHNFGLRAEPPTGLARMLDLRGNVQGHDLSDLASWQGELYADIDQADLSTWSPWLDLPLKWSRGAGALRVWLSFEKMEPTGVTAELRLADVSLRLRPDLPDLNLAHLEGRLTARRTEDGYAGELRHLSLATPEGIVLPPTDARLQFRTRVQSEGGEFRANGFDIGVLAALAERLPLPGEVHQRLQAFNPQGRFSDLEFSWRGAADALQQWQAKGNFHDLALAAYRELPGFSGISGRLKGSELSGEVVLDSRNAEVILPAVFPEPRLALASLAAEIGWQARDGQVDLLLKRLNFANHDATGEANGRYRYTGQGPGEIDLTAKLTNGAGNAVWRYMPLVVNKDARDWLQRGIVGGRSDSTTLRLKGPLYEFPFVDGKSGIFQVKGSFQGATLKYAESWPEITGIDGDLLFEGARMLIRARRGTIMGTALAEVQAEIPDLLDHEEILTVNGKAQGETQRFLDFIEASPVEKMIDHFTEPMKASGQGDLDLKLVLPLRHLDRTRVDGRFRVAGNQVRVLPELPVLTDARGEFSFTGDRLQARGLRARLLGTPVSLDVKTLPGGTVRVEGNGTIAAQVLRKQAELNSVSVLDHLSGEMTWRGSVSVKKPGADILVESNLDGLSSSLPEPFNKSASGKLPLKIEGHVEPKKDSWKLALGSAAAMQLQQAGDAWRGRVALGSAAVKAGGSMPARGVALSVAQPRLDLDIWRNLFPGGSVGGGDGVDGMTLAAIDLKVPDFRVLERNLHNLQLQATRSDARWRISLDSKEAQGQLNWDAAGAGRISGRLTSLMLPATESPAAPADTSDDTRELPAVDLVIDSFRLRDMALGEVRVKAENREASWLARVEIKNDAARLTGDGRWRPSRAAPETRLDFKLEVADAEKLLGRLGMPDAVRRGSARLEGDLNWAGSPASFDLASLSGRLKFDAEKGQFKKLEPGVGRLLGVLSLQSLPRRITLDFRDVFSEGFAFDSINGEAGITRGLMTTRELKIRGPAAKVMISGQANLIAETQDLKVRVQPAIGESIAVGAMLAHPVAGAVAWAAQKVLNDPLDQVFAYEYAVTGGWADPKVEKISAAQEQKGLTQ